MRCLHLQERPPKHQQKNQMQLRQFRQSDPCLHQLRRRSHLRLRQLSHRVLSRYRQP
jgi:hypothetical protein